MYVYVLNHKRKYEEGIIDGKLIGIYSSYDKAMDTVKQYSTVCGFCDYPNDFSIEAFKVLGKRNIRKTEPKYTVYFLQYECTKELVDHVADIGVFSTRIPAAIRRFKYIIEILARKHGGLSIGGKFSLDVYKLDENHWKEGFLVIEDEN